MQLTLSDADLSFGDQIDTFISGVFPQGAPARTKANRQRWERALIEHGWQAYKWDKNHGGTGWNVTEKYLWETRCGEMGLATQIPGAGISMLGPILYGFGTQAQCLRYLPSILNGSEQWCQGYSEPGSGSDLASLRTSAIRQGDHYLVNGEKVWTSGAHKSQRMFCLTRTSSEGKKQHGITFLLIDMADPGISVHPVISIDGNHSLNRIELNDVRVPLDDRIGEEHKGWTYAKGLLTHERTGLAFITESQRKLTVLKAGISTFGLSNEAELMRKVADVECDLRALVVTELRVLDETAAAESGSVSGGVGQASSILKLKGTLIIQRMTELLLECSGYFGLPYDLLGQNLPDDFPPNPIGPAWCIEEVSQYLIARSASIAGGSDEVQKNIIAKQVLQL